MRPSEVRDRVLHDHASLRARIRDLEGAAQASRPGDAAVLAQCAEDLLAALAAHMRWEDLYLAPALTEADAWGAERAERLAREHFEQREELAEVKARIRDPGTQPEELATRLRTLAERLLRDMEEEEAFFLDDRVLRDDVVGIDVETG